MQFMIPKCIGASAINQAMSLLKSRSTIKTKINSLDNYCYTANKMGRYLPTRLKQICKFYFNCNSIMIYLLSVFSLIGIQFN